MKIIRNNIIPPKGFRAINLFGVLFARKDVEIPDSTIRHERIHTAQMREMLYVFFYLWYVVEWLIRWAICRDRKTAYYRISFEREAYANTYFKDYLERRKHFEWIKHL